MSNQTPKRMRAAKTTRGQYILYLEQLKSNKAFRENKFDGSEPHIIDETWEKLVTILNASGGPVRNIKEWKRVFTDWRSQTKRKARKLKSVQRQTGNEDVSNYTLTDLEQMLMDTIGWVVVEGMPETPELGIVASSRTLSIDQETANLENTENAVGSSTAVSQNQQEVGLGQPLKRKRTTVISCLKEMISNDEKKDDQTEILQQIRSILEKLTAIQNRKLQLKQLELQLKYPDVTFVLDNDEVE